MDGGRVRATLYKLAREVMEKIVVLSLKKLSALMIIPSITEYMIALYFVFIFPCFLSLYPYK